MKKLRIFVLLLLVAISFSSCNVFRGDTEDNFDKPGEEQGGPSNIDDEGKFDIGEDVYIVTSAKSSVPTSEIYNLVGRAIGEDFVKFIADDQLMQKNEIIIGNCNREVASVGYERLSTLPKDNDFVVRYGIYTSGNSVAIVYDEVFGLEEEILSCAIDLFGRLYVKDNMGISIGDDEFYSSTVKISDLQDQKKNREFENFENSFGQDASSALRQMYSQLYTDGLVNWLASMYDSNYGGFYNSSFSKDNLQIDYDGSSYYLLPDIESTVLAIEFMEKSGMACGFENTNDAISPWMRDQLIKFVKEKQNDDGYFYHPQWENAEISIYKMIDDLVGATELLSKLESSPTYDTPSGVDGDGLLWWGQSVASVNTSAKFPDQLQDKESFTRYLEQLNIKDNSYAVGSELVALSAVIKARDRILESEGADYSFAKLLTDYLDENCDPSTGCWEEKVDFSSIDGLMEITKVYGILEKALPYPLESALSALAVLNSTEKAQLSVSYSNAWGAVSNIINNVEKNYSISDATEIVGDIRKYVKDNAVSLIESTTYGLKEFSNSDGSFSYCKDDVDVTNSDLGYFLADPSEGNVRSSVICTTKLLENLYHVFGYPMISAYGCDDYVSFMSIISENKLKYNFAPSDSLKKNESVNYKIYEYRDLDGEVAPMIKIYDSENYKDEKLQRAILTHIITGDGGILAGLDIEKLDFYLSVNFENSFTYHKASSESEIVDGCINYKITAYSSKATVLRIYNSYEITDVSDMREILIYLITSDDGANAKLSLSDIDYYIVEWQAHNIMYEKPSIIPIMSAEEVKKRAMHVDLNVDDEYSSLYSTIISMYG